MTPAHIRLSNLAQHLEACGSWYLASVVREILKGMP
jgi:hypothetical protein